MAKKSLIAAIQAEGLNPPQHLEPDKITRFPGHKKRASNKAAWCWLSADERMACFGDWSTGLRARWRDDSSEPNINPRAVLQQQRRAKRERERKRHEAVRKAQDIWRHAEPINHAFPYLINKGIPGHNARLYKGSLVLPVIDFDAFFHGLQFINANGTKRFLTGTNKRGHYIPLTDPHSPINRVMICEGWATACTLTETHTDAHIIAAIDAGNLMPVAINARQIWPQLPICIAGDDDRLTAGNPGASKAKAAAAKIHASIMLPDWPASAPEHLTDFNDLAQWQREHSA